VTGSSSSVEGSPRRDEILRSAAALFATGGYRNTSMRQVAAASGILAGSLYHHFPSKEAIALRLVEECHADLDRAAREAAPPGADPVAALRSFARDIAGVSCRHRAALKISIYDAPPAASDSLKSAVRSEPASLDRHWRALIDAAAEAGALDERVDAGVLRHVLRRVTLQIGVMAAEDGVPAVSAEAIADCTTSIIFDGLAAARALPADGEDEADGGRPGTTAALGAVDAARARWAAETAGERAERGGEILDTARVLFARLGFETTTMRDIADEAGVQAGNLYRYFPSKDAMVAEILSRFSDRLLDAYADVLAAGSPPAQTLEAICWLLDQAGRHFSREIEILKGPTRMLSLSVSDHYRTGAQARYEMLVGLIAGGVASGDLSDLADPALVASCVREIMWSPMRNLAAVSPARVRDFCRHALLAGAATGRS
jgi:AcrR family transcriptional regulator